MWKKFLALPVPAILHNRYVVVTLGFSIWMIFFDRYDIISQLQLRAQLNDLKREKEYLVNEAEQTRQLNEKLFSDKDALEKFAREEYLMKKENEDLFVIVEE